MTNISSAVLGELAAIDFAAHDLEHVLTLVSALAAASITGADEVSVSLVTTRGARTVASTGSMANAADEAQYETSRGPCLEAAESGGSRIVSDLASDDRWLEYRPRGLAAGVQSSLSLGLPVQVDATAALNVYSRTAHAFDESAVALGEVFASYAAIAIGNAARLASATERADDMRAAMESRAHIEQAKGILIALHGCDEQTAFDMLTRESQRRHEKLRDVAAQIVAKAQTTSAR